MSAGGRLQNLTGFTGSGSVKNTNVNKVVHSQKKSTEQIVDTYK